ncbi:MAG: SMP-30/gluconolactonase/LRE family protein [Flavobacteriales bacterium]|jgi:arylesterase / paraoxonase|nr:SMP-30/gluconolactonase/LRE family protein [Flavobacteriales bacterium]
MIKKYLLGGLKIIGVVFVIIILKTLYIGGVFKTLVNYNAGETTHIYTNMAGTEDMAFDTQNNLIYISSSNRWATMLKNENPLDGIYALNLSDSVISKPKKMLTTYSGDFHPHGISVVQQDSSTYVFAVNHNKKGNFIEKFIYKDGTLMHLKSYANALMFSPNDVAAVSDSTFYVSNDHGSKSGLSRLLEDYLQLPKSYVLYFDGRHYKHVVKGLKYANGVTYSPLKKQLYIATSTGQTIGIYKPLENGNLILQHYINTHTGVDNITIDAEGAIWTAAHPKLLKFTAHAKDSTKISPSEVLKIYQKPNGVYKTELVYLNDGSEISGSSVALKYNNLLFVGDVFEHKLLRIKLN